jgi:hypothetical protein
MPARKPHGSQAAAALAREREQIKLFKDTGVFNPTDVRITKLKKIRKHLEKMRTAPEELFADLKARRAQAAEKQNAGKLQFPTGRHVRPSSQTLNKSFRAAEEKKGGPLNPRELMQTELRRSKKFGPEDPRAATYNISLYLSLGGKIDPSFAKTSQTKMRTVETHLQDGQFRKRLERSDLSERALAYMELEIGAADIMAIEYERFLIKFSAQSKTTPDKVYAATKKILFGNAAGVVRDILQEIINTQRKL